MIASGRVPKTTSTVCRRTGSGSGSGSGPRLGAGSGAGSGQGPGVMRRLGPVRGDAARPGRNPGPGWPTPLGPSPDPRGGVAEPGLGAERPREGCGRLALRVEAGPGALHRLASRPPSRCRSAEQSKTASASPGGASRLLWLGHGLLDRRLGPYADDGGKWQRARGGGCRIACRACRCDAGLCGMRTSVATAGLAVECGVVWGGPGFTNGGRVRRCDPPSALGAALRAASASACARASVWCFWPWRTSARSLARYGVWMTRGARSPARCLCRAVTRTIARNARARRRGRRRAKRGARVARTGVRILRRDPAFGVAR